MPKPKNQIGIVNRAKLAYAETKCPWTLAASPLAATSFHPTMIRRTKTIAARRRDLPSPLRIVILSPSCGRRIFRDLSDSYALSKRLGRRFSYKSHEISIQAETSWEILRPPRRTQDDSSRLQSLMKECAPYSHQRQSCRSN